MCQSADIGHPDPSQQWANPSADANHFTLRPWLYTRIRKEIYIKLLGAKWETYLQCGQKQVKHDMVIIWWWGGGLRACRLGLGNPNLDIIAMLIVGT